MAAILGEEPSCIQISVAFFYLECETYHLGKQWISERGLHFLVDRELSCVESGAGTGHLTKTTAEEEVVGQGDTVARGDPGHLVFTITVKGRPPDVRAVLRPVEGS